MAVTEALIATARPRLLAAVRRQATASTIGPLIRTSGVWDLMKARGIKSTGHNVVIYWAKPGEGLGTPGGLPVDIGAEITEPFESDAELQCVSTPSGRFISVLHTGPIEELGEAYDAIVSCCQSQGLKLAGPYWEFYGHWTEDATKFETTVYWSLAE
jgi:effector-binding domain-containing protein